MNFFKHAFFVIYCISIITISACNNNNNEIKGLTSNADKLVIEFYKEDAETLLNGFQVVADTSTEIMAVVSYLTTGEVESVNCNNNGVMHFYKGETEVFTSTFRISGDCAEYYYSINGEKKIKALSQTGKAYLNKYYDTAKSLN